MPVKRSAGCEAGKSSPGFWMDLRSKRDITSSHLDAHTAGAYNFYDPLLSPKVGVVDLRPPFDWDRDDLPRSWRLNLHSFRFADFWIKQFQHEDDPTILERLAEVCRDYVQRVWLDRRKAKTLEFVLSDVSVASRAAVIAYLLGQGDAWDIPKADVDLFSDALREHVEYAAADENYNSNNHGLFNDLHVLIAMINYPLIEDVSRIVRAVSDRFVETFVDRQISPEFIHLEHTPSYALLWVLIGEKARRVFQALDATGLTVSGGASERVRTAVDRVRERLWWFILPDKSLANFGDQGRVLAPEWLETLEGEYGHAVFPRSGYAFHKRENSYLALVAAYHATKVGRSGYRSSSHKQRDELSLMWAEREGPILVDTGLRSFDYGPERRYTYSKQAHNTLSIDPHDFMNAGILDYMDQTAPYGSGILDVESGEGSTVAVMAAEDPLLASNGIFHVRVTIYCPERWLMVVDCVRLRKGARAEWNYHFHERWRCKRHAVSHAVLKAGKRRLTMRMYSSREPNSAHVFLHRGDFEPVRGWRFAGDPIAITNLRQVEWLERKQPYLKATIFALGSESVELRDAVFSAGPGSLALDFSLRLDERVQTVHERLKLYSQAFDSIFPDPATLSLQTYGKKVG